AMLAFLVAFSACAGPVSNNSGTRTPRPNTTENASVQKTPVPAASSLKVDKEALRGTQVNIWSPWFGSEASLFESQVTKFNKENEWGIVVHAEDVGNYAELFARTNDAIKKKMIPNAVIALPEQVLVWGDHMVD